MSSREKRKATKCAECRKKDVETEKLLFAETPVALIKKGSMLTGSIFIIC